MAFETLCTVPPAWVQHFEMPELHGNAKYTEWTTCTIKSPSLAEPITTSPLNFEDWSTMRWAHLKSAPVTIAEPFNSSLPLTNGIKCKTAPAPAAPAALPAAAAAVVMRGSEADGDAMSADVDAAAAAAASLDVTRGLGLVIVERSQLGETIGNTLAEKALNAQNAGAQAVLIVNVDGRVMIHKITSSNHSKRVRIPVFAIEREAGMQLVELVRKTAAAAAAPAGQEELGATGMEISLETNLEYKLIPTMDMLREWVISDDVEKQYEGTKELRSHLSKERNPPIQEVVEMRTDIRHMLTRTDCKLEAAWVLSNIASGMSYHTAAVVDAGAVPLLVALLSNPMEELSDQAAWALANISGDSPQNRDVVLAAGAMPPLMKILDTTVPPKVGAGTLRNCIWTLSNLCRGKNPPPDPVLVYPCLSVLVQHLDAEADDEILQDACWTLSYLSDTTTSLNVGAIPKLTLVVDSGALDNLNTLINTKEVTVDSSSKILVQCIRCIGNIASGDGYHIDALIRAGLLASFEGILSGTVYEEKYHDTLENLVSKRTAQTLKHQICRGLSNITAGTIKQIQAVVDANLIPALVKTAKTWDGVWSVRKEAGYALANAVSGGVGKDSTVTIRTALQTEPVVTALCDVALTAMEMRIVDAVNVTLEATGSLLSQLEPLARAVAVEAMWQNNNGDSDTGLFNALVEGLTRAPMFITPLLVFMTANPNKALEAADSLLLNQLCCAINQLDFDVVDINVMLRVMLLVANLMENGKSQNVLVTKVMPKVFKWWNKGNGTGILRFPASEAVERIVYAASTVQHVWKLATAGCTSFVTTAMQSGSLLLMNPAEFEPASLRRFVVGLHRTLDTLICILGADAGGTLEAASIVHVASFGGLGWSFLHHNCYSDRLRQTVHTVLLVAQRLEAVADQHVQEEETIEANAVEAKLAAAARNADGGSGGDVEERGVVVGVTVDDEHEQESERVIVMDLPPEMWLLILRWCASSDWGNQAKALAV